MILSILPGKAVWKETKVSQMNTRKLSKLLQLKYCRSIIKGLILLHKQI